MPTNQKVTDENVKKFISEVVRACPSLVTLKEKRMARSIPSDIFEMAFKNIFNSDLSLAKDIMNNRVERLKDSDADKEIEGIHTLPVAGSMLASSFERKEPILLISDVDNDGALSQAIAMEARRISDCKINVQSKTFNPGVHGFSVSQIESWVLDQELDSSLPFTVMVSDLGTNQLDEQREFSRKFPNANLIICDHHQPVVDKKVETLTEKSVLVSPFVKGSVRLSLRGGGGVSGGYLLYSVIKDALVKMKESNKLDIKDEEFENRMNPIRAMGKAANLLDYVSCDVRLKPIQEEDIKKALDVSKQTNLGKSAGAWIGERQADNIKALNPVIGAMGTSEFESLRIKVVEQNHLAKALFESLPSVINGGDESVDISFAVASSVSSSPIETSQSQNYIEMLKPYVFNFSYENQLDKKMKSTWMGLAEHCFKEVGNIEKEIVEKIREYNLVLEESSDYSIVTRPASRAVKDVFTSKQLNKAFSSLSKPFNMRLKYNSNSEMYLGVSSDESILEVLKDVESEFLDADVSYSGHATIGEIKLTMPAGSDPSEILSGFVNYTNDKVKSIRDNKPVPKAIEVKPIHLSIVKEMFQKMRTHIEPSASPLFVMRVSDNMTFEDRFTAEKKTVSKLVEGSPWGYTSDPLDFSNKNALIIPNQALQAVANENFEAALGVTLLPNGSYMANKVVTASQLKPMDIPVLSMPLDADKKAVEKEYEKRFKNEETPLVDVPRKAAYDALNFTSSGKEVFENTEAVILGILNKTGADSYVVLDVEADGAGNAQCIDWGLAIYERIEGSGKTVTRNEISQILERRPDGVKNYRDLGDGNFQINEELSLQLASQLIGKDGGQPIRISSKVQNLTNLDQDMIDKLGATAEESQERLLDILSNKGNFALQAHNLPYDNNIIRVNYPEVYELISKAIHIDTAVPAKEKQIAYSNLSVNMIDGQEYFNAEHKGYNLNTLLATESSFDFPSIKGKSVLQVRGDDVQTFNMSTRITTKLDMTRDELTEFARTGMSKMQYPEYSIDKLLRVASIHDMISKQPVKSIEKISFNDYGTGAKMPEELWDHFQENYGYHLSVEQNLANFSRLEGVEDFLVSEVIVDDPNSQDATLIDARKSGSGDKYDPNKKRRSKKEQEGQQKLFHTFTGKDVLKSNAITFLNNNPENAERYSLLWAYEMVLSNHETTRKDVPAGFIQGVSEKLGVEKDIVKKVYDDTYVYKTDRGIDSYRVHEPHRNVGLNGDAFLEVNAFYHVMSTVLKNPYLTGKFAFNAGVNPVDPVVSVMTRQAALSSMQQVIRQTTGVVMSEDKLNNYSAKQLDQFSEDGVSIKSQRSGVAKMKVKVQGSSDSSVSIELPDVNPESYRQLPADKKKDLGSKLELAVSAIILHNSTNAKGVTPEMKNIIEKATTHPTVIETLGYLKEHLGSVNPTSKDVALKKMMKSCMSSIIDGAPLKLSANNELSGQDLNVMLEGIKTGIKHLSTTQNFDSLANVTDIAEQFEVKQAEFDAFNLAIEQGEKVKETPLGKLSTPAQSAQTRELKHRSNVLVDHEDANPELAIGIKTTKKDPMDFLLKSELASLVMDSEAPKLKNDDLKNSRHLKNVG